MCGICGIASFKSNDTIDERILTSMTESMTHRGPDDKGWFIDGAVGLGHTRLSIIDLSTGKQPIHNEDSSLWITCNGEIYNYQSLRQELKEKGHHFYTDSDTETLVHLYEEYGEDMLQRINGMFAFCIWDRAKKEMLLARDRMGQKPLYYSISTDAFVFASEAKALLKFPSVSREIDLSSLSKYLTYEYIPAPHTIFRDISKLQPGCCIKYNVLIREININKYWDIPLSDDSIAIKTEEEYAEELVGLLRESIKLRLRSDVPLGVLLSGGIDSSLIVALAAEQTSKIQTFTIGLTERSFDESVYANKVSETFNTEHNTEMLDATKLYTLLPEVMNYLDEPLGDASVIPTYLLSRFAVKKVKVALGGEGGDELFAGYPTYQAMKLIKYYNIFPKELRVLIQKAAALLPVSHKNISFDFKIKQFLRGSGVSPEIAFILWMGSFSEIEKKQLLSPAVWDSIKDKYAYEDVLNYLMQTNLQKNIERALYLSAKLYLQDDILVKVDRASMANSLEVRSPLLDYRFVEFASKLPTVYKLSRLKTKYLLKRAFGKILPKEILARRKKGFGIPVATWISGGMKDILMDYLDPSRIRKEGYFNPDYIQQLIDEHMFRKKDNRKLLWTLMVFQMWKEKWAS